MKKSNLKILVRCAILVAMAFVLSQFKIYEAPYGGSVTLLSMAPIVLISCMYGIKWGLGSAFVYSILNLLLGLKDVAYVPTAGGVVACILLDYIFAFTVIGFAGIFVKRDDDRPVLSQIRILGGTALALIVRFACHIVSGAVIWYDLTKGWYADDPTHIVNQHGAWIYSILYNSAFMLPEIILTLIAVPFMIKLMKLIDKKFM